MEIVDADGHVVEPNAAFTEHLDPRFRGWAPRVVRYDDHFRYACGDRLGFRIYARPETVGAPGQTAIVTDAPVVARGADDPAGRLLDLDIEGIDTAVLYPTYGLMIQGVVERGPAVALCRAVNDWLASYFAHDPRRLVASSASAPCRCAIRDPGYEPLWSFLEEADVPVAVHPGMNGVVPNEYFASRFDEDFTAMHAAHFPVEQMMNVPDLVAFGILERHPNLRVDGCGAQPHGCVEDA